MSDEEGGTSIPDKPRRLRACLYCSYVHTAEHFNNDGCPNCRDFFQVDGTRYVRDCTTANFSGVIAMMQPSQSWVARHQRIGTLARARVCVCARVCAHVCVNALRARV